MRTAGETKILGFTANNEGQAQWALECQIEECRKENKIKADTYE